MNLIRKRTSKRINHYNRLDFVAIPKENRLEGFNYKSLVALGTQIYEKMSSLKLKIGKC